MLSQPSRKLARRILSEVSYEDRIQGVRLRERAGLIPATMYSFAEVVGFLTDSYPQTDFQKLVVWIRQIMEDPELADHVTRIINRDFSDREKAHQICEMMETRMIQCKRIV